ncbi:MAG: hypothetical protein KGJ78_07985 [Alphaproteobacteria bacterium]|nr:hypothetical protein [Alphaproteobacteria bacterium]
MWVKSDTTTCQAAEVSGQPTHSLDAEPEIALLDPHAPEADGVDIPGQWSPRRSFFFVTAICTVFWIAVAWFMFR